MSAGSSSSQRRSSSKPKGAVRAKSGCYTCRIRRKKCDEKPNEEGACQTCVRLRLQCLGYGAKRPDWMREGNSVAEIREKIKNFLAENGMIKGHSGPAALRPAGESASPPGASASLDATSPLSGTSLPLSQAMPVQGTGDLSTPLSATSTLTPEDRSSSPHSPPGSRVPPITYTNDRPFPPNYVQTGIRTHYEQAGDGSASISNQDELSNSAPGVLLLSNGRPIPIRSQSQTGPIRHLRRSPHPINFGETASSGLGLFVEQLDTSGQGSTINNSNTRRSPPALSRRRRTADLLGYGHHVLNTPTLLRSQSMTTIARLNANVTGHAHVSSMSSISSRFSAAPSSSSSFPAASCPTPYPHTPSIAPSMANFNSNAMDLYSPTFGSASSNSSSPPMPSHDTPFTPYTPLPALPVLPPSFTKPSVNVHWSNTVSMSPYISTSMSSTGNTASFPPGLDAGSFVPGMDDVNLHWTPIHSQTTARSNYLSDANIGSDIRVKTEPDTVGFDVLHANTADDSNSACDTTSPLRPRSMGDDGYVVPRTNAYTNSNIGLTQTNDVAMNSHYNNDAYNTVNNHAYTYGHNAFSTHSNVSRASVAPTSMDTRDYAIYTLTDNSPHHGAPQLSPDSPKPAPRSDPMIGYAPASTSHLGGQVLGDDQGYVGHGSGQFALHPGSVRHGTVGGGSYNYGHTNGYSHEPPSSSWPVDGHVRHHHQEQLLNQQQEHLEAPNSYDWTQATRRPDIPPPSMQSSFGPLYHYQDDYPIDTITMDDIEMFAVQQAPMGVMGVNGVEQGTLIPFCPAQALINEEDFNALPDDDRQRAYQEYASMHLLQPALADPTYADRADRSLVEHYLRYVRPVQYFFLDERVVELLRALALNNAAVRNAICSVASVHKRRMREGSVPLRGATPQGASRRTPLAFIESLAAAPEGDDGSDYYARTQMALTQASNETLTEAEAMAGLQCISSFLFAGGLGEWDFFLGVACRWVGTLLASIHEGYHLDVLTRMRRNNELQSFIVRTTMWFEVLASVTIVREPKFLWVYRALFADSARIVEVDGPPIRTEAEFSMLEVMGCDNLTFLALAEISALAAWKEEETKNQTLSFVELAERKSRIEENCLRALAEGDMGVYRNESAQQDDSLENRRRLTADIFRASARLYFHTVLSGDKPGVKEIRQGVIETINALKRVPTEPKSLRRSVVRSVVFPICLAGCMTDDETERATLKQLLESEGGAGNCGSVVAVMETVWERRDRQRKNAAARGGRRCAEYEGDVSWRDVLRERGGGMPILLV